MKNNWRGNETEFFYSPVSSVPCVETYAHDRLVVVVDHGAVVDGICSVLLVRSNYHSPGEGPGDYEFSCDGRDIVSYESVMVVNPDRHFCSSHVDKETGMKFVNWGDA